eukprot:Gb_01061 [translate_table: standard]
MIMPDISFSELMKSIVIFPMSGMCYYYNQTGLKKYGWVVFISIAIASGCCNLGVVCADEATITCATTDREALLSFKAGITEDTTETLRSWTGKDCCEGWEGIECDTRNGRVIRLILQSRAESNETMYMRGTLSDSLGNLSFLQVMIMSDLKYITGNIPSSISRLSQLTQLYLENNKLNGLIPASLGKLSRLQALSLTGNRLSGHIPASVGGFHDLIQLNLGKNRLTGNIPKTVGKLRGLQFLDFNGNLLSGPVPAFIGSFGNMTYLDLSNNVFSGDIPASFGNLSNVLDISLARNKLTGNIPSSLGRLSSLSSLSLSNNMLVGIIPASLSNMSRLWYLNLSRNHLSDPLPSSLANTSSLLCLDLSYNNLHLGRIPDWITRKEMTNLHLAGCGVRECLSTWKPKATSSFTSIDLSNNNLTGDITHLLKNMSSLQRVYLSNNSIRSNLSKVSLPDSISTLDLHSNLLYGSVENLFYNISESCSSPGGCLEFINLANNKITGKLPVLDGERSIKWLDLSGNHLKGSIPPSISMLKKVERLDFSGNRMEGKIPGTIGELKELRWLDLSRNGLKGKIPRQILGLKHLKHMNLRYNHLCGQIPQGKPLNVFPSSAYGHNDCLCGSPLPQCTKRAI